MAINLDTGIRKTHIFWAKSQADKEFALAVENTHLVTKEQHSPQQVSLFNRIPFSYTKFDYEISILWHTVFQGLTIIENVKF